MIVEIHKLLTAERIWPGRMWRAKDSIEGHDTRCNGVKHVLGNISIVVVINMMWIGRRLAGAITIEYTIVLGVGPGLGEELVPCSRWWWWG